MSYGFQNAGYEVTGFELWKTAADTHDANFKNSAHRVDLSDVESAVRIISGINPFIITGSPPCNDFSTAGKRIESDRADLTVSFAKIVTQVVPRFFVMENVPRVQQSEAYKAARELFKKAGYGLTETVLTASYYGVPQRRERFFCIGAMGLNDGFLLETLAFGKSSTEMTVRDYFGNSLEFEHYYAKPPYASGLRRSIFNIDEPSLTIRGVNGNITNDFKRHNGDSCELNPSVRKLTYFERSQIQTFPPDFKWDKGIGKKGGTGDIEQMIGNAVPVKLAEAVATCIKEFHTSASRALCVPVANDGEGSVLKMTNNTKITVQNQSAADAWVQDTSKTVSNVRTRRSTDSTNGVSVVQQQFDELRNFVLGRSSRRQKAGAV